MQLLPEPDEQDWILDGLRELVAKAGFTPFVLAPVVEPTDEFFPDPYVPGLASLRAMTRRLMDYAGLESHEMDFETFVAKRRLEMDEHGLLRDRGHDGTAAWFAGIDGSRCLFGISEQQLPEPDVLAATMSHEVAHAWRRIHGLETEDRDTEEMLTDLTTVYLGLGILTGNGAYRYRASGELTGGWAITRWTTQQGGYLPVQAMAFALAAQALARGGQWKAIKRIQRLLEPNQGGCFRAACEHIHENVADLRGRIGIPDKSTWPQWRPAPPAPRRPGPADDVAKSVDGRFNAGQPVFRIRRASPIAVMIVSALVGWLLGCVVMIALDLALNLGMDLTAPSLGAVALGIYGFRRTRQEVCSDVRCESLLEPSQAICPGCGGDVRGAIRSRRELTERMDEILGTAGITDGEEPD